MFGGRRGAKAKDETHGEGRTREKGVGVLDKRLILRLRGDGFVNSTWDQT